MIEMSWKALWGPCWPIFCFSFPHQMGSHILQFYASHNTWACTARESEGGLDGLNPSVLFQKPEPSSQPEDQQNRKQLKKFFFFFLFAKNVLWMVSKTFRQYEASEPIWVDSDHIQRCSDTCKVSNPFADVLYRKGTYFYEAHTNSQDFASTT